MTSWESNVKALLIITPVLLPEGENGQGHLPEPQVQCMCKNKYPVTISNLCVAVTRHLMETTQREEFLFQLMASNALGHHAVGGLAEQCVRQSSFGLP